MFGLTIEQLIQALALTTVIWSIWLVPDYILENYFNDNKEDEDD